MALVLGWMTWTHTVILLLVGAVGALPGFAVYGILCAVEKALVPSHDERPPLGSEDARREF
jgi:hypothetical protein